MREYILFFINSLWYTLGAVVICGLGVWGCRRLFVRMLKHGVGRKIVLATGIIGTPVHELSHALMCLLFGHKIVEMKLWIPGAPDGALGYVSHTWNKKNPYQVFGKLFIGIGPILGGMGVLTLIMWLCFPVALETYMESARAFAENTDLGIWEGIKLFLDGLRLFPDMVREAMVDTDVAWWVRLLGVIVLFCVSLHVELSPPDIKSSLTALPIYGLLVLLLTLVCAILGADAMASVESALAMFSAFMTSMFVIVLVMSVGQILIAFPFWLLQKLIGGKRRRR